MSNLQFTSSLVLTATVIYVLASTLIHCYMLKRKWRLARTPGEILRRMGEFSLGFCAIMAYWITVIIYTQSPTHDFSYLLVGIACLVTGNYLISSNWTIHQA